MAKKRETREFKIGKLIRERRKQLRLTLVELCGKTGLSAGYLSVLERDNAQPTLGSLAQIAKALDVELEYFISTPKPKEALTKAGERPRFSIHESGLVYESLGTDFPGAQLSSYVIHVPPGYKSETVRHEGEEIIFIIKGEICQILDNQSFTLSKGDSLHFRGSSPHSWRNSTDVTAILLWTGTLAVLQNSGVRKLLEMNPAVNK